MSAKVSIVVPTFNRADVIGRALRSIIKQTYADYEVIVVDDGSTDDTESAVSAIKDARIRYIPLSENQGVAHARNIGIQEAAGDFIAFLDSDDEWLPDKLQIQMAEIEKLDDAYGMVYCRMGGWVRDGSSRFVCPPLDWKQKILEGNIFHSLLFQNVIGTPTMLVRRECFAQAGGFKEALRCLEDWEMILRIAKRWKIGFVDQILVEVHKSVGSVTSNMGWHLVARCYMVSLYREEMSRLSMLDSVKEEILGIAADWDLYEEIRELLNRDFEL